MASAVTNSDLYVLANDVHRVEGESSQWVIPVYATSRSSSTSGLARQAALEYASRRLRLSDAAFITSRGTMMKAVYDRNKEEGLIGLPRRKMTNEEYQQYAHTSAAAAAAAKKNQADKGYVTLIVVDGL